MGNSTSLPDYDPRDAQNTIDLMLKRSSYPNHAQYTFEHMQLDELARCSQEEQMRFSDAVCRRYAMNPIFLQLQKRASLLVDWEQPEARYQLNENALGNLAFIAHWNPKSVFWQKQYQTALGLARLI